MLAKPDRGWLAALLLLVGCGGESRGSPPVAPLGGCGAPTACAGTGGAGGETGGNAGGCATAAPGSPDYFAVWPMPHPESSKLPNPARYDNARAGVVVDLVTGLMWEASPFASSLSLPDAVKHCAELRAEGHCDWRLPSRIELVSLVDFTQASSALDPSSFPATEGDFLTASTVSTHRFRIGADGGTRLIAESMSNMGRVRCVRREASRTVPEPRYGVSGESPDDIVTDHGTGLVWQRRPSNATYSFADAQTYCAGLTLGGGGFRMPSMKELQTVLDEGAPNLVDPEVFPDLPQTQNVTFWTSTKSARGPNDAWFVRGGFTLDGAIDAGVSAKFYARCVK